MADILKQLREIRHDGKISIEDKIAKAPGCVQRAQGLSPRGGVKGSAESVKQALRNSYFGSLGLSKSMRPPKPNSIERARYGPVCPVVWEGRCREASPYPDLGSI